METWNRRLKPQQQRHKVCLRRLKKSLVLTGEGRFCELVAAILIARSVRLPIVAAAALLLAVCPVKVHAQATPAAAITLDIQIDRVFLLPGETQFATVTAHNPGSVPAHVPVALSLWWDLARTRVAGRSALEVPAQGSATATFAFPAGPGLYGYEARVTDPADPAVAPASAFFTVHHNLWQVSMQGDGLASHGTQNPSTTEGERKQMADSARSSLCNHVEFFAWAPDDFGTLAPETNVWYAGQTSYPASRLALHESIDALHAVGATVSAYAKGQMSGPDAFEFFRRHPEWSWAPYNSVWSVLDIKQFSAKSPFNPGDNRWPRAMTDFGSWPVALAHIKQLRLAANEFRFDAVRYDDHLQVGWVNGGYNPMTARNMEQITSRLRLARPYFGFGFNWITGATKVSWEQHGGKPTPDWPAAGAAGSQIMDEEVGQIFGSSLPPQGLPWMDYLKRLGSDRAMTEPYGGKVFVMQNRRLGPVDSAYRNALVLALRLFHTNYDAAAPGQFARFATRYACLLRNDNPTEMHPGQVQITAARPVWRADIAYRYALGNGRGRIIVPVINPPTDANVGLGRDFPAPLPQARVQVSLPPGWRAASASAIDAATLQVTPLPVPADRVDVRLPPVILWSVVVIDCKVNL